ncbi:MAG TPA: (2Fe-2S)-binding protein [Pyrinomonadaceae bacterium]
MVIVQSGGERLLAERDAVSSLRRHAVQFRYHRVCESGAFNEGCGFLIANASALTETIKDLAISRAATFDENTATDWFGELPPGRTQCAALCREALLAALANYHNATREEWTGDEALICTCFGVSEKSIERAIHTRSLRTIEQVTRTCNAGGGCQSCRPLIEDILDDYWRTAALAEDINTE